VKLITKNIIMNEKRKEIKGMNPLEVVEMTNFIQKYHKFAGWLSKEQLIELKKIHPKMNEYGFNIKYIDTIYDSRFGDIWSVSFRGLGTNVCFNTNTDLELPYETLSNWIMAYLTNEWIPTPKEEKSILLKGKF